MRASLLFSVFSVAVVTAACVEEEPIVTGNRDAGGEASAPIALVTPAPDEGYVDPPSCRHCSDVLGTSLVRGTLCRKNADPSSSRLASTLVDCACYDKCVAECGGFCTGSALDAKCRACMEAGCVAAVAGCAADQGGGS